MDCIQDLIDAIEAYVFVAGIESYDDISLSMDASNIIISEKDFNFYYKYKKKYSLKQCLLLVSQFLASLNPSYLDYYNMRLSDGTFYFDYLNPYEVPYSCYDYSDGKRVIYIPVTNTIEDAFSIVHELFHDMNLDASSDEETLGRFFFTEALSFLGELLFSDFLLKSGKSDKNADSRNLFFMRKKALEVNFVLRLIQEYLENGYLDRNIVLSVIRSYPNLYLNDILETIFVISKEEELCLEDSEVYVLSELVAIYMYDRIKNNYKCLDELFDLNEILSGLDVYQVLDYLGLEHDNNTLTGKSYSILRDKYKSFIKRC